MAPISVSTHVERPAEEVLAYAIDPAHFSEWQLGVVGGHTDHGDPATLNARCTTTRRIGLGERSSTSLVTRSERGRGWSSRGLDGPIRAAVDVDVRPAGPSACELTIAVDFEGRGVGRLLVPLLVHRQARAEMPANLERLKHRLER